MTAALAVTTETQQHPLDIVEQLAAANDWAIERASDDEIHMVIQGSWADLHLSLNWRDDLEGLHLACMFDIKVPSARREEVGRLIALVNEQLYFGHFDVWRQEGSLMFRNGLLLGGGAVLTQEQCEDLISLALEACERYYPAFQFVIWGGKTGEEAIRASLLETVGEA